MQELISTDLHFCVSRIPKDVRDLVISNPSLFIAGGFIRSTISGESLSDIDLFGADNQLLKFAAQDLCMKRKGRVHETKYAYTVIAPPRVPVQFIKRWLYSDIITLVNEFDYTVCQAALQYIPGIVGEGGVAGAVWKSCISDRFYPDLAAKRLVYTSPQRDEEAGGSMLRMRKFLRRGYNIQASSMAGVFARLVSKLHLSEQAVMDEPYVKQVITGVLREVDPLRVIDGVEFLDEHEIIKQDQEG